jgi:hypothetical protein
MFHFCVKISEEFYENLGISGISCRIEDILQFCRKILEFIEIFSNFQNALGEFTRLQASLGISCRQQESGQMSGRLYEDPIYSPLSRKLLDIQ